jgi:hypothetical protein
LCLTSQEHNPVILVVDRQSEPTEKAHPKKGLLADLVILDKAYGDIAQMSVSNLNRVQLAQLYIDRPGCSWLSPSRSSLGLKPSSSIIEFGSTTVEAPVSTSKGSVRLAPWVRPG